MSIFGKLLNGVVDTAQFLTDDHHGNKLVAAVRREHDAWMRTARLGVRYWTVAPAITAGNNAMSDAYDIHGEYIFTGPAGFGMPNQLKAEGGTTSWRVWYQHGPLTTVPQQTAASWEAAHAGRHAAETARMQQAINDAAIAELRRLYPASVNALVNA